VQYALHPTIEEAMKQQQQLGRHRIALAVLVAFVLPAISLAQSQSGSSAPPNPKTPAANTQKPQGQPDANPFPTDTDNVPLMPNANSPGAAAPPTENYSNIPLPGEMTDPVRSPDDSGPVTGDTSDSSSSSAGLDNLLKPPPDTGKHGRHRDDEDADFGPEHPASAKEDESVGSYYLDQHNWKGALSRFESALVLDPENPDVYWGLAESQKHLGDYADARANYLKVIEYDPDSKHSKDAKKALKEPEIAGAPGASSNKSNIATQR